MRNVSRQTVRAALLLTLLLVGAIRPELIRLLVPPHRLPDIAGPLSGLDRRPLRLRGDGTPSELRSFLAMARAHIDRGRTVSVILPPPHEGFSYTYWRASYELSARRVLLPQPIAHPAAADFVAVWRTEWSWPGFREVWNGSGGRLLQRR
jgi:hypothetical protein